VPLPLNYLFVAGLGRRKVGPREAVIPVVAEQLRRIGAAAPDARPLAMSSGATGADQVFLAAAVSLGWPIRLILPVPKYLFEKDFVRQVDGRTETDEAGLSSFRRFAEIAIEIEVVSPSPARREAFTHCSNELIKEADVVVALWDRQPGKQGGTNEGLLTAGHLGTPTVLLDPDTGRPFSDVETLDASQLAARYTFRHGTGTILRDVEIALGESLRDLEAHKGSVSFEDYRNAPAAIQYQIFGSLLAAKADKLSKSYKRKNLSAILAHGTASALGIYALIFWADSPSLITVGTVLKIALVTVAVWLAKSARRAGEQNQWVKARFVREINRSLGSTAEIARVTGECLDSFVPTSIWILFRHLHRPLVCFHCLARPARASAPASGESGLRSMLELIRPYRKKRLFHNKDYLTMELKNLSQQDYQLRTAEKSKIFHQVVERVLLSITLLFYASGCVVLYLSVKTPEAAHSGEGAGWLMYIVYHSAKLFTVLIPIFSAALLILPNLFDIHRRRKVAPALASQLAALDRQAEMVEKTVVDCLENRSVTVKVGDAVVPVWSGVNSEQQAFVGAWARDRFVSITRQSEHAILTEVIGFKTFVENVELG
jgi:hypothetical protein